MNDNSARTTVLAWLQQMPPQRTQILRELAQLALEHEDQLRRILRPHWDAGFGPADLELTRQRLDLDQALRYLRILEIACQLGTVRVEEVSKGPWPQALADVRILFNSEAFLRYCNAYQYFGIRFLAGRIAPPVWFGAGRVIRAPRTSNARPFALVSPPTLTPSEPTNERLAARILDQPTPDMTTALAFLDDFVRDERESDRLELWLRGLLPEVTQDDAVRFRSITTGMRSWAREKAQFYVSLEEAPPDWFSNTGGEIAERSRSRPVRGWVSTNPAVPRLALSDMYWIARLLRADVSANATVTYSRTSWLTLLANQSTLEPRHAEILRTAEEVLRSVFDFVCDLVQNADEITDERERRAFEPDSSPEPPARTARWAETFDEELEVIDRQRGLRQFRDPSNADGPPPPGGSGPDHLKGAGWTERIKTGKQPHNLFGLAFSGGGIRSATFNLGVLQALKEADLLRRVDYVSTVSGGGFIGSWLVGNVSRTSHWLGRLTTWDESIAHLRRYSNYLAPRKGALAPDVWTMWASWARNTFLVQLTAVTWLSVLLLAVIAAEAPYLRLGQLSFAPVLASAIAAPALFVLLYSFLPLGGLLDRPPMSDRPFSAKWIWRGAVLPFWLSSIVVASALWNQAIHWPRDAANPSAAITYGTLLWEAWRPWKGSLIFYGAALVLIAAATLWHRRGHALWIGGLTLGALYLQLCGVLKLFLAWAAEPQRLEWYAYVFGPPLVVAANTISLVLFVGFCGRNSRESIREWWTRFIASIAAYGVAFLGIASAAVFGPKCVAALFSANTAWINWAAVATFAGTIVSGLVAGQSGKTTGNAKDSSRSLQILARVAGILFIVGGVLAVSLAVYAVLVLADTDRILGASFREYWATLADIHGRHAAVALGIALGAGLLFSWWFEINIFGLNQFYRNRLVRCYLGATRWVPGLRRPLPFTQFDPEDDMKLAKLGVVGGDFRGPFPIFNCALNLGGSGDLALHTRHSASFSLTPKRCGSARARVGYAPTHDFAGGVMLGQAVAISGAAASPNMGYNTSPLVAFLLTMFNVRLGWWFPNPGREQWDSLGLDFSLYYLVKELFGSADEHRNFVNVSDGGHFENLGVYELVRRRCKVIIACDAECDGALEFGSLGNLVRLCETDFGARIDIDVSSIRREAEGKPSRAHCAVGKITYCNGSLGHLIYVKASLTGDEPIGVAQYVSSHPTFPHETTADQFFAETQFESYRQLGEHVIQQMLRGCDTDDHHVEIAERLYDVWAPAGFTSESFIQHMATLDAIWDRFRQTPALHSFMNELHGFPALGTFDPPTTEERSAGLELIQLMENAFLDLRLDEYWDHPDNRGWVMLLSGWARSPRFRTIWRETHHVFGIRFEYFCDSRLGLRGDRPVVRR